jgi:hypothetical protein
LYFNGENESHQYSVHLIYLDLNDHLVEEASSWKQVHLFRLPRANKHNVDINFQIQIYMKNLADLSGHVSYINLGYNFKSSDGITRLFSELQDLKSSLLLQGIDIEPVMYYFDSLDFEKFFNKSFANVKFNFKDFTALELEKPKTTKSVITYDLVKVVKIEGQEVGRFKRFCNLEPKEELLFIPYPVKAYEEWLYFNRKEKRRIGILTLSKNDLEFVQKSSFFQLLLPSFFKTISQEELVQNEIIIYLGYDQEDPVFDRNHEKAVEYSKMFIPKDKEVRFTIKYYKLPRYKRLTLYWNILAWAAYRDDCDYLFQLNDDTILLNSNWLTQFIAKLTQNNNHGVIGPNDVLWNCKFITQAFVSRKHIETFGWMFPPRIRDWFSDNWISLVYGKDNSFCSTIHKVKNGIHKNKANSKRYVECESPIWREELVKGRKKLNLI